MTFRVDDALPMEDAEVQAFWAKAAAGEGAEETEEELELGLPAKSAMQCLVSGENGPVEEMMPVPVKGFSAANPKWRLSPPMPMPSRATA